MIGSFRISRVLWMALLLVLFQVPGQSAIHYETLPVLANELQGQINNKVKKRGWKRLAWRKWKKLSKNDLEIKRHSLIAYWCTALGELLWVPAFFSLISINPYLAYLFFGIAGIFGLIGLILSSKVLKYIAEKDDPSQYRGRRIGAKVVQFFSFLLTMPAIVLLISLLI